MAFHPHSTQILLPGYLINGSSMYSYLTEAIGHQQLTQLDSIRPVGRYAFILLMHVLQYLHGREQQAVVALRIGLGVHAAEDVVERLLHGISHVVLLNVSLALGVKVGWFAASHFGQKLGIELSIIDGMGSGCAYIYLTVNFFYEITARACDIRQGLRTIGSSRKNGISLALRVGILIHLALRDAAFL